jgi:murein DD-endopeptidase MepM/ murein hydrolase activator NlpD
MAAPPAGAAAGQGPVSARRDQPTAQAQLAALRDQEDAAADQEADLVARLEVSRSRRAALDARVDSLDGRIRSVQQSLDGAESRLEHLAGELVNVESQLASARTQLADARRQLHERAVAAYTDPTGPKVAELLLHVRSLRELTVGLGYLEAIVHAQAGAVARFDGLRTETEHLRDSVDAKREEARQGRDVVAGQRAELDRARQAEDDARQAVLAEEATQQGLLADVERRKADYEAQIAVLTQQSDAIAALLRGLQAGEVLTPSGHGVLGVPLPGAPISSGFGLRVHPIFHTVRMHTGVDFAAPEGAPILAAADGVVVAAGPYGGYGTATILDHGGSIATLYAHQSAVAVAAGQRVQRGQVIGYVGCTGFCTGPHLHFEVRVAGSPVDPLGYL